MSAMARTTYRRSLRSNGASFDKPQRDEQHIACTSGPSTDFPVSDPLPLFFSDLQDQPDLQKFKPFAISQWTSILARVLAGGLVASAFAILVLIGNATRDQATQPASNQPATRQTLLNDDPARASNSATGQRQYERAAIGNTEPRGRRKRQSHRAAESNASRTYKE